jgi:hypothetical protein
MSEKETKEEILARMQARRKAHMRPKRIRGFVIGTVTAAALILYINYKFESGLLQSSLETTSEIINTNN